MADIIKRMNYFDHQFLRQGDLNLQQDYHMDRHRRHNRVQHTWGVAEGLVVAHDVSVSTTAVTVAPGTAIDGEGREIVLAAADGVELSGVTADQTVYITITYAEELSDPTAETGAEGDTRWSETPLLEASVSLPSNPELSLVLAQVDRTGTDISAIDNHVRTLASVKGGDLEVRSLILTDTTNTIIPEQWPRMHIGAAERADVEGSLRITQNLIVDGTISGDIAVGSVQAADLVDDAVTSAKLREADGTSAQNTNSGAGVKTNHIQNGAVTNAKLANDSVNAAKIAAGAVGNSELANNAVTNAKVAAGSINHSRLNLDGGTNPHGTTAANVGALANTGGSVNGNVQVNGQLSSVRTNAGAGTYYSLFGSATGNGTGQVRGLYTYTSGSGTGAKYGIHSNVSGSGQKFGIFSSTSGSGTKYGGYFTTSTAAGDNSTTYGFYNSNSSGGNGWMFGLYTNCSGAGTGTKYGIQVSTSGGGQKYGGYFSSSSATGVTSQTYGLYSRVTGAGTGSKYGIYSYIDGSGQKYGALFNVRSPATEAHATYGSYCSANSSGTGVVYGIYCNAANTNTGTPTVIGIQAHAYGAGTGTKYGIIASATGSGTRYAGYFSGNVHVTGTLSKSSGTFLIDHPLDPYNKTLRHHFVESPENLCLYRGKVKLDARGTAKVGMPGYFAALTTEEEATVSLTAIGKKPFLAGYEWNKTFTAFTVYGEAGGEVSYLVLADRDDPAMHLLRRPVEEDKGGENFEKGKLLNPEAYNEPAEKGVDPIFAEPLGKKEIQGFKEVEKARQAEEKTQDKLRVEMEKEEQKQQGVMARELAKAAKEQEKAASKQDKKKKTPGVKGKPGNGAD